MMVSDLIAGLESPGVHIVDATNATRDLLRYVAAQLDVSRLALSAPDHDWDLDSGHAVVLVACGADEPVDLALKPVCERARSHEGEATILLLLGDDPVDVRVAHLRQVFGDLKLDVARVEAVSYETLHTAIVLMPSSTSGELSLMRAQLMLERYTSAALHTRLQQVADYEVGLEQARGELRRQAERIRMLTEEANELRRRLTSKSSAHDAELRSRDGEITQLRHRVRQVETSTSFRLGHAIVRLIKDPTLLRRVPAWIRRQRRL